MKEQRIINILIVDDRPENILALESILEQEGRRLFSATSGNDALKILLNQDIGLVLLDVQMPDMDGFEVAHILKSNPRTADIAIIFITANSKEERYMMQGYSEGAVDYLYKPLDTQVTIAKIAVFEELYHQRIALKRALQEVNDANKKLDQFVYIVSHDLKAPLRGIASLAEWIKQDVEGQKYDDIGSNMDLLRNRVERMQNMITGILEYSRARRATGANELVDTNELIHEIIDILHPPAHIHIEVNPNLPHLAGNRMKLQQVFQNIIGNAIKYNDKPEGKIAVSFHEKPGFHEIVIEDNGKGIAEENKERVFELFQTESNKEEHTDSTGVGLTIVKSIIEDAGGKIYLESEPGIGTKFIVNWPKEMS